MFSGVERMPKEKKTLVIVESPSKAKTINKYLGDKYIISSSMGHIIDLPKSRLAVDVENNFTPEYITIRGKAKILNELKRKASRVSQVLLATDPDREGEAISWHLSNVLSNNNENIKRIEFNEITGHAIQEAVKHPREINESLVNAQQARRILDRIVGYYISPILWKKVKKGLSAGRVQSVALKTICDRENEIDKFVPEEYWLIDAILDLKGKEFNASFYSYNEEKIKFKNKAEVDKILDEISGKKIIVTNIQEKERKRNPYPPYITSKLQQDASNRIGFKSSKTMMIAQQLYEGIDIEGEGLVGLITYMRTDSTRISDLALESVRNYISTNFNKDFLPEKANYYKNRKGAQDAHEAIRPTNVFQTPDSIKKNLTKDQFKIYNLIWKKFVASQMTHELSLIVSITLRADNVDFKATGSKVLSKGFTAIEKENKTERQVLPQLKIDDEVELKEIITDQHFTTPPPRYNDASLVKFLEESTIGRPSTYSPTINTLEKRYYVNRSGKQFIPTILGKLVNEILDAHFHSLVSVGFTANMEDKLDLIEESKSDWKMMLKEFYYPFKTIVDEAQCKIEEMKGILDEETEFTCYKCGKMMLKKLGKYGFFLACSGFPECRNSKPLPLGKCPAKDCVGNIVKKSSKGRGPFYACTNYPDCTFVTRDTPVEESCPICGKAQFKKRVKGKGEMNICLNELCERGKEFTTAKINTNEKSNKVETVKND